MSKTRQSPLAVADPPEQKVEDVELVEQDLDAEAEAPAPEPQATEQTAPPAAPAAGPRVEVKLPPLPGVLPAHWGQEIRTRWSKLLAEVDEVHAAYQAAAIARQAICDRALQEPFQAKPIRETIDASFEAHMAAHARKRAYLKAALALQQEAQAYAREQQVRDMAEVERTTAQIDKAYAEVGRAHHHKANVMGHEKVRAAKALARETYEWVGVRIIEVGLNGPVSLERSIRDMLAEVEAAIQRSVMEFAGIRE